MSGAAEHSQNAAKPIPTSGVPTLSTPLKDGKMEFQSYFKMDAPQTETENCVAHNGS
jgi:hypothetical protein